MKKIFLSVFTLLQACNYTLQTKPETIIEPVEQHYVNYDPSTQSFIELDSGVNEYILNTYDNRYDSIFLKKLAIANTEELETTFYDTDLKKARKSRKATHENMKRSFALIEELDARSPRNPQEQNMREIMNMLDNLVQLNISEYKKLRKAYEIIGRDIQEGEYEDRKVTYIEDVLFGTEAQCRDEVATYYPLLTYYGFNIMFNTGRVRKPIGTGYHIWLEVVVEEDTFALDSHWYKNNFIPLDKRNNSLPRKLDEKYVRRKY